MQPLKQLVSSTMVLPYDNIDTDRIIPARFLTTTERAGLGKNAFRDWRYNDDGTVNQTFELNKPAAQGCHILVAGRNFGCGSSREHAPWALLDYGVEAVISSEIADIFKSNALKNGLLAIVIDEASHRWLLNHPGCPLSIDVAEGTVTLPGGTTTAFELEPFARHCLLEGLDPLGFLEQQFDAIRHYEQKQGATA